MNSYIPHDDLKVGKFVIVSEWLDEKNEQNDDSPLPYMHNARQRKPLGDPLKVLSVALPFIVVEVIQKPGSRGVLDTRLCRFIQVDIGYVRALVPTYKKKAKNVAVVRPGGRMVNRFNTTTNKWETIFEEK